MQTVSSHPPTQIVFLSRMFNETMQLLEDAHDYFSRFGPAGQVNASPVERLVYSSEMSRITLRLSSVMSWLMARRAEHTGEISRDEAVAQFRLAFHDICLKEMPEMHAVLPSPMCELMKRSLDLYRRTSRLDDMIVAETLH